MRLQLAEGLERHEEEVAADDLEPARGTIDSKTVHMEAHLFYLLTNAGHCARMVKELNGGKKGFNRVDLASTSRWGALVGSDDFEESGKIGTKANIMGEEVQASSGSQSARIYFAFLTDDLPLYSSSPTKSRRSIFKRRQHMAADRRQGEVEARAHPRLDGLEADTSWTAG